MAESIKLWADSYPVHSYEVDSKSRAKIVSIINYFQESAWRNAESLGIGFHDLATKNLFWVLSRLYVEIYEYPLWGQNISLETWAKGIDNMFALRDFRLKSNDSEKLLGAGTSAWLIIDGKTQRLQRIEQTFSHIKCNTQNAIEHKFTKITLAPTMTSQARTIAGYSDLDVNNHVNNVSYLNWAVNYFPVESPVLNIRSAELNFLSEARLRSPIEILYGKLCEKIWICSLRNPETEKEYCRIKLKIETEK